MVGGLQLSTEKVEVVQYSLLLHTLRNTVSKIERLQKYIFRMIVNFLNSPSSEFGKVQDYCEGKIKLNFKEEFEMTVLVHTIEKEGNYSKILVDNPIMSKFGEGKVYKIYLGEHLLGYQVEIGLRQTTGDTSLDIKRALHSAEIVEKELRDKIKKSAGV